MKKSLLKYSFMFLVVACCLGIFLSNTSSNKVSAYTYSDIEDLNANIKSFHTNTINYIVDGFDGMPNYDNGQVPSDYVGMYVCYTGYESKLRLRIQSNSYYVLRLYQYQCMSSSIKNLYTETEYYNGVVAALRNQIINTSTNKTILYDFDEMNTVIKNTILNLNPLDSNLYDSNLMFMIASTVAQDFDLTLNGISTIEEYSNYQSGDRGPFAVYDFVSTEKEVGNDNSHAINMDGTAPVISGFNYTYLVNYDNRIEFSEITSQIKAVDDMDGDLSSSITYTCDYTTSSGLGSYLCTASVSDLSGNTATFNFTILVVDITKPTSSLTSITFDNDDGISNKHILYTNYIASTLSDNVALAVFDETSITTNYIFNRKGGTYQLSFSVKDTSDNTQSYTIPLVINDVIAPTFGSTPSTITTSVALTNSQILAYVVPTDETSTITKSIVSNNYDNKYGTYEIVVKAIDMAGNESTKTISYVVNDEVLPTFSVGSNFISTLSTTTLTQSNIITILTTYHLTSLSTITSVESTYFTDVEDGVLSESTYEITAYGLNSGGSMDSEVVNLNIVSESSSITKPNINLLTIALSSAVMLSLVCTLVIIFRKRKSA